MDLDVDLAEVLQIAADDVPLDGEQADFRLHREAVGHGAGTDLLVIPNDFFKRERNLLPGFEADNVVDLLFFNRRQLDEPGQATLAGHGDDDDISLEGVTRQKLLQRLAGQLVRVGVGLAEDFWVLDVIEGGGGNLPLDLLHPQRFQRALPNINAPHARRNFHGAQTSPKR